MSGSSSTASTVRLWLDKNVTFRERGQLAPQRGKYRQSDRFVESEFTPHGREPRAHGRV
jgi:hypothetical protein